MDKIALSDSIVGDRIILKKINLSIAGTLFSYVDKDRDRLGEYLPWVEITKGVEDSIDFIKMSLEKWDSQSCFVYSIHTLSDMKFLGLIDTHNINWNSCCLSLGYWCTSDAQGSGHMSEAVSALSDYLFSEGFNRVEIQCDELNERSKQVATRCGFTHEGTLRENAFTGHRFRNTEVFGKLKGDK